MARAQSRGERIKSVILAVILVGVVAYFALTSIPSAQRPTLRTPDPTPAATGTVHNGQR